MAETVKKGECDPKCGFIPKSHDGKEIIDVVTRHATKPRHMTITEQEKLKGQR